MTHRPELSPEDLRFLANDEDFQQIIASNPELDRLEAIQYDEDMEQRLLRETLGLPIMLGKCRIRSLTPGMWAYLWSRQNPYICGGEVKLHHLTEMLSVLAADDLTHIVPIDPRRTGLSPGELHESLTAMIRETFSPLQLLPRNKESEAVTRFDSDWLLRVCSIAAKESCTPLNNIIHSMSLHTLCRLYVNWRRTFDRNHSIRRRPASEIARKILDRTLELGYIYLKRKGI